MNAPTQPYINYLKGVAYRHKDMANNVAKESPKMDFKEFTESLIECKRMKAKVRKDFCGTHYGCKGCDYENGRN